MATYGAAAAQEDLQRIQALLDAITAHAVPVSAPPEIIAAIISRETRGQSAMFIGDGGHGCGPMQIDDRSFPQWCAQWKAGALTPADGIAKGVEVLLSKRAEILSRIGALDAPTLLQGSIAAYNCGAVQVVRAIQSGGDMDIDYHTTGHNYSADVLERSKVYADLFRGSDGS